jgi:hypothetical protein
MTSEEGHNERIRKKEKIGADSQFAPFLDEIIDTNDLPLAIDEAQPRDSNLQLWMTSSGPSSSSAHVLHEMSIVRSRIGFDEQAFREKCQRLQAELASEFKSLIDGIYDMLDALVAEYSKSMYQIQVEQLKDFELQLAEIRRSSVQAATMEQAMQTFVGQIQAAYRNAFDSCT